MCLWNTDAPCDDNGKIDLDPLSNKDHLHINVCKCTKFEDSGVKRSLVVGRQQQVEEDQK